MILGLKENDTPHILLKKAFYLNKIAISQKPLAFLKVVVLKTHQWNLSYLNLFWIVHFFYAVDFHDKTKENPQLELETN